MRGVRAGWAAVPAALALLAAAPGADRTPERPAAAPAPEPATPPILAGAATRIITPDLGPAAAPVPLAGFGEGRLATSVRDDLTARALVLDSGDQSVALVTLDLFGLAYTEVERIRASVRDRTPPVPVGWILVSCTRDHAAPDATGQFTPAGLSADPAWLDRVVRAAGDAVEAAWRGRQPARLSMAVARLPRTLSDSRQPRRLDDQAALVRIERTEGKIGLATIASFSASPESLGRASLAVSADYPGEARRALEDAFGGPSLFLVGASGGRMIPEPPAGAADPVAAFGGQIARALQAAWSGRAEARNPMPGDFTAGAVRVRSREVRVPVTNPALREALASGRRRGGLDAAGALAAEVAVLEVSSPLGPALQIACVPGAIYPELAQGGIQDPQDPAADLQGEPPETTLRSVLGAPVRMIAGACGGELGDIIPASQWDEKAPFAYGLAAAQRGEEASAGPGTAAILLRAFADLMR